MADLSQVTNDKLLAKVRNCLRRDYHFPKASNSKKLAKFNVTCVYSDEPVISPIEVEKTQCDIELDLNTNSNIGNDALAATKILTYGQAASSPIKKARTITGINCAGYGSSVCVTAPIGFAAAQLAINRLLA